MQKALEGQRSAAAASEILAQGVDVISVVQRESDYAGRVVAVHRSLDANTDL